MTKVFTRAILGTNSMMDPDVVLQGLCRLVPSVETRQKHVQEESSFPLPALPLPQDIRAHKKDSGYHSFLKTIDPAYIKLAEEKHLCMLNASTLNVQWLDALKRDNHGIILYDTDGFVEGSRFTNDLYLFHTWENGQLKKRGVFSVAQEKWVEEPQPVTSWRFRPQA